MTAKEYLSQGFYLDKEINEKILEIEKLVSDMCRCTQQFSDMPPDEHNDNSAELKMANYIDKHNELENEINDEIDQLDRIKSEIRKRILKVKNPKCRLVLLKRYWRFLKWEQIQEEMGYEETSSVHKLHRKAIREFIKINGNYFLGH